MKKKYVILIRDEEIIVRDNNNILKFAITSGFRIGKAIDLKDAKKELKRFFESIIKKNMLINPVVYLANNVVYSKYDLINIVSIIEEEYTNNIIIFNPYNNFIFDEESILLNIDIEHFDLLIIKDRIIYSECFIYPRLVNKKEFIRYIINKYKKKFKNNKIYMIGSNELIDDKNISIFINEYEKLLKIYK